MGSLYLSTLGNDPVPALMGLNLAKRFELRIEKVVFLAQPPQQGYEQKREALFRRLEAEGLPYRTIEARALLRKDQLDELRPDFPTSLVNLTGGTKLLSAQLLDALKGSGARAFIIDAHRIDEAPKALLLEPRLELLTLEPLTLDDYRELYLLGPEWVPTEAPLYFPRNAQAVQHPESKTYFVVHQGRPYLFRDALDKDGKLMQRAEMTRFAQDARQLGGELCLAMVPWHQLALDQRHENERDDTLQ